MPGGDGTGPLGLGSMTGRGLGYCAGYSMPGYTVFPGRGRGMGRGWGRGFGRGFRRGMSYGYWNPYYGTTPAPVPFYSPFVPNVMPQLNPEDSIKFFTEQKNYLEQEMNSLKKAFDDITEKILELESKK